MTPIEFRTRRKMLGLSQEEIGRCIALVSPMPDGGARSPIKQTTIARWETDRGLPAWADTEMLTICGKISRARDVMTDDILDSLNLDDLDHAQPLTVSVPAYEHDRDLWATHPQWDGWPASIWNLAALNAVDTIMKTHKVGAELVAATASTVVAE